LERVNWGWESYVWKRVDWMSNRWRSRRRVIEDRGRMGWNVGRGVVCKCRTNWRRVRAEWRGL